VDYHFGLENGRPCCRAWRIRLVRSPPKGPGWSTTGGLKPASLAASGILKFGIYPYVRPLPISRVQ